MARKPEAAKPLVWNVYKIAKKAARPLRLNQRAELVPAPQFARWHELASAAAGLSELDREMLDVIAGALSPNSYPGLRGPAHR